VTAVAHLAALVRARLGHAIVTPAGDDVLAVERVHWLPLLGFLKADPDAELEVLADLFAIDHEGPDNRYEVRALLRSPTLGYRAQLALSLPAHEPTLPTLTGLFASAWSLERELFEMHGIIADGHPALRPLYLYDGFVGHPLRRDYRAHKEQPLVPLLDDVAAPTIVSDAPDAAGGAA
jgi:NADH-quinone oxidoreductase subunit C